MLQFMLKDSDKLVKRHAQAEAFCCPQWCGMNLAITWTTAVFAELTSLASPRNLNTKQNISISMH